MRCAAPRTKQEEVAQLNTVIRERLYQNAKPVPERDQPPELQPGQNMNLPLSLPMQYQL